MRYLYKILILTFSVIIFSCSNDGEPSPRAKHLNNKAMKILMENFDLSEEQIDEGIRLLDEATDIEPDYYLAYWNKMTFLFMKNDYKRLLETNKELQKQNNFQPYLIVQEGLIYELKGDSLTSKEKYKKGIAKYDSIINNTDSVSMELKWELIQCLTMSNKEEKARKALLKLKKDYPEKELLKEFPFQTKKELLKGLTKD